MSEIVKSLEWRKNIGIIEVKPQNMVGIDYINGDSKGLWLGF